MGSGASKNGKKQTAGAGDPSLSLSLRRRRRLLLGRDGPRRFELVPPQQQYAAVPDEDEDLVFSRLDDAQVNKLRRGAANLQDKDGLLDENAIELLELRLGTGSSLSKRLFAVGQVQVVAAPAAPAAAASSAGAAPQQVPGSRRGKLTCYELLALYSLIKKGSTEDLLELLFCTFDIDGDDRLNQQDLSTSVPPFLQLTGAMDSLEKVDQEDFEKLNGKARAGAIKQLIDNVIKQYGTSRPDESQQEKLLIEAFRLCDPEGLGMIKKRNLVETCLSNQGVAAVIGLPERIRQENSRDEISAFFSKLAAVDDRAITLQELAIFQRAVEQESLDAVAKTASGAAVAAATLGAELPAETSQATPLLESSKSPAGATESEGDSVDKPSLGGASTDAAMGKEPEDKTWPVHLLSNSTTLTP
eukprot:TRINITY_DN10405_c0_g1_i2.p1 TRINITY_DN10405_c0_g1~~TRINITY_DN10405_c0_g1_i2.p1  ORF type:complete len:416 (+),score=119.06 TRINITY_DN10405_c0_g1_i2:166-1413(+)